MAQGHSCVCQSSHSQLFGEPGKAVPQQDECIQMAGAATRNFLSGHALSEVSAVELDSDKHDDFGVLFFLKADF